MSLCVLLGQESSCLPDARMLLYTMEERIGLGAATFYVSAQGRFSAMARDCLRLLCTHYPHIRYSVVEEDELRQLALHRAELCLCCIDRTDDASYTLAARVRQRGASVVNLGKADI